MGEKADLAKINFTNEVTGAMGEALNGLFLRGLQLLFYWAGISINGCIWTGKYEASPDGNGLTCEFLAEHVPSKMVYLPVNFMFVDGKGEAARVVIEQPGKVKFLN